MSHTLQFMEPVLLALLSNSKFLRTMSAVLVESGPDTGAIWHFGEPNHEQRELARKYLGRSLAPRCDYYFWQRSHQVDQ